MKKIVIAALALLSISVSADYKHTNWNTIKENNEDILVQKAEDMVSKIRNGEDRDSLLFARKHECSFRRNYPNSKKRVKIKSLDISKFYSFENGKLVPYFEGKLYYSFYKCRKKRTRRF
jgi:hypothetical protein